MKSLTVLGVCVVSLICASAAGSLAQTDDLMRIVKSGICPEDLQPYDSVKYSVHCAGMGEESCDPGDKGCFEDERQCWDEVNRINKQIFSYNNFVRNCAAHK
jgi:hypothetical protein